MKPNIRYSIIMAVHNGAQWLDRALESLRVQSWADWELLVQDAVSSDGTSDIVARHAAEWGQGRIKLVSEADSGVYQAWNRALARASGDWIMFLGADDALVDAHVLARAARELWALPEPILFAQAGLLLGKNGETRETLARSKAEIFRFFISGMPLLTPAVFFRAVLFAPDSMGGQFDESYRIAGDFAFVARHLRAENLALLPFITTYMETGGLSSGVRSRSLLDAERIRVLQEEILPRSRDIVQACIDTYGETHSPFKH